MNRLMDEAIMNESWTRSSQSNQIYLMVKDPTTLFVYWEVDQVHRNLVSEHLQQDWEKLPCFLRLNDVTLLDFDGWNCPASRRIVIPSQADNWYLHGAEPARRYLVDFGVDTPSGKFLALLRSNVVATPPLRPRQNPEPSLRFGKPFWGKHPKSVEVSLEKMLGFSSQKTVAAKSDGDIAPAWQLTFDGYSLATGEGGIR